MAQLNEMILIRQFIDKFFSDIKIHYHSQPLV